MKATDLNEFLDFEENDYLYDEDDGLGDLNLDEEEIDDEEVDFDELDTDLPTESV